MDSRKFSLAMRLIEFVERLTLASPDASTPQPAEPAQPRAPAEVETNELPEAFDEALNKAIANVLGEEPS